MTGRPPPRVRLIDIVTALSVMAALVVLVGKGIDGNGMPAEYPEPVPDDGSPGPIFAEAGVFETDRAQLGVVPSFVTDSAAHVRSLDMYRRLRAYPGAPPRVPHGLTDDEYRDTRCQICHLRGGWVARFGTYAPVTPHPGPTACLQCHVPQDDLVGRDLPVGPGVESCAQCHAALDVAPSIFVATDWRPAHWPETDLQAMPESPHRIPHDFQMRANCVACHSGPGAVEELRTDHPERVNCRQCHVPVASEVVESFPAPEGVGGGGRP